jgi:membrane protease YdiL (CAAX protease family)
VVERYPADVPEETILPGLDLAPGRAIRRLGRELRRALLDSLPRGRARVIWAFTGTFVIAELLADAGHPGAAAWIDAALAAAMIAWFLTHGATSETRLVLGLALLPLTRLFSLTSAVAGLPPAAGYLTTSLPVIVAAGLAIPAIGLSARDAGFRSVRFDGSSAAVAAAGIPLGLGGYLALQPVAPIVSFEVLPALGAAAALAVAALAEELVFRGLIQTLALQAFVYERPSLVYASALFALMYLGTGAPLFAAYVGVVSLAWGWAVLQSKSLWPAVAGHALFALSAGIFWPWVLRLFA